MWDENPKGYSFIFVPDGILASSLYTQLNRMCYTETLYVLTTPHFQFLTSLFQ
jgi:hypothetical protein